MQVHRFLEQRIERGVLRVSQVGIAAMLPVTVPLQVERISGGRIYFRTFFTSVGGVAEVLPRPTLEGRLRLEITSFRAGGLLPIPIQAVVWANELIPNVSKKLTNAPRANASIVGLASRAMAVRASTNP